MPYGSRNIRKEVSEREPKKGRVCGSGEHCWGGELQEDLTWCGWAALFRSHPRSWLQICSKCCCGKWPSLIHIAGKLPFNPFEFFTYAIFSFHSPNSSCSLYSPSALCFSLNFLIFLCLLHSQTHSLTDFSLCHCPLYSITPEIWQRTHWTRQIMLFS